jgi:hypothetical protein
MTERLDGLVQRRGTLPAERGSDICTALFTLPFTRPRVTAIFLPNAAVLELARIYRLGRISPGRRSMLKNRAMASRASTRHAASSGSPQPVPAAGARVHRCHGPSGLAAAGAHVIKSHKKSPMAAGRLAFPNTTCRWPGRGNWVSLRAEGRSERVVRKKDDLADRREGHQ